MTKLSKISVKNIFYQLFVKNEVKLLRTFHFVPTFTHLECHLLYRIFTLHTPYLIAMKTIILGKYSQKFNHQKEREIRIF